MLRFYFLQQWYALADEALEDALYDSRAMRTFAGIDLSVDPVPGATALLKFRHLLEAHELAARIFAEVGGTWIRDGATSSARLSRTFVRLQIASRRL